MWRRGGDQDEEDEEEQPEEEVSIFHSTPRFSPMLLLAPLGRTASHVGVDVSCRVSRRHRRSHKRWLRTVVAIVGRRLEATQATTSST